MIKVRQIVVGGIVAVVLGIALSATASAATPGWMVNGAQLLGGKKLASGGAGVVTIAAGGVSVSCDEKTFQVVGEISSPTSLSIGSMKFGECTAEPEACSLLAATLTTTPLLGVEITLDGTLAVRGTLKPEAGELVTGFQLSGEKCALKGNQAVKGSLDFLAKEGQDEKTAQLVSIFSLPKQLLVGSAEGSFTAGLKFKLESGETWSYL